MEKSTAKNPRSVLIIDDDLFLLDMYAIRFTQDHWSVETSTNVTDALQKIRGGLVPDVLLTDVVMPEIDGFEMLEILNTEKLLPHTTKIFLSNLGLDQDLERGKALGADSYIVKASATPSEVVAHVEEVLGRKQK